jgi:hypothetical protein
MLTCYRGKERAKCAHYYLDVHASLGCAAGEEVVRSEYAARWQVGGFAEFPIEFVIAGSVRFTGILILEHCPSPGLKIFSIH